jgi:hypothetical protein
MMRPNSWEGGYADSCLAFEHHPKVKFYKSSLGLSRKLVRKMTTQKWY